MPRVKSTLLRSSGTFPMFAKPEKVDTQLSAGAAAISTSTALPPAFSIFSTADLENACAVTVSFFLRSPLPSTLMRSARPFTRPLSRSDFSSTLAPASKRSRSPTLTSATRAGNGTLKPRFGRRRASGVCPPSNSRRTPLRAYWPFWPRPAVLPRPEPTPRPRRTLSRVAPMGLRILLSVSAMILLFRCVDFFDGDEVQDFFDRAAEGRRVLHPNFGARAAQAEAFDRREVIAIGHGALLDDVEMRFHVAASSAVFFLFLLPS